MNDIETLNKNKEGILSTLRLKGPSLPVQIAKTIEVPPLFTSAFLSELKAEKKIKISNMRVGSSPIYFLSGQEEQLENFVEHLNNREKEAYALLKKERVLKDGSQTPIVRVALRAIKDFATPINLRVNGELNLFWKYFTLKDSEATELIERSLRDYKTPGEKSVKPQTPPPQKQIQKPQKKPKVQESRFSKNIKEYLAAKDIELLEILIEKKKEFTAKIRTDGIFGKQEYFLMAKDKKNVTENDLTIAIQKAQQEKMPAAFLSPGEVNNKTKEHLKQWSNLIKFEKLKF